MTHGLAANIAAWLLIAYTFFASHLTYWLGALRLTFSTVLGCTKVGLFWAHDSAIRFPTLHSATLCIETFTTH